MKPITNQAYKLLHDGCVALAQVEVNGIRIDTDYLEKAIHKTSVKIRELTDELRHYKIYKLWRKTYGSKTTLGSREQLGRILFDVLKYPCPSDIGTRANELNLKSTNLKFVDSYLRLEKLKKARSTYLRNILRETADGYLHPNFPLHLVRSYRGSSDHPNFTNIPIRDPEIKELVRRAFIARKNHQILEIDFKGAEVCSAACYHKDKRMIEYIENPKLDLHHDTASKVYKLKKSEVSYDTRYWVKNFFVFAQFYGDWYKHCAPLLWKGIEEMDLRVKGGTGYDLYSHLETMGVYELGACDAKKEPEEGTFERHLQEVEFDFWNKTFKKYNQWKKKHWWKYCERGFFETLTGFIIQGNLSRKQVINYPIQGTSFHWLLWCLIRIQKLLKKYKMKSLIVGQIHDSIVGDIHRKERKDYIEIVKQVVYEEIRKHWKWIIVPLVIECEAAPVGGSWYEKEEVRI